MLKSTQRAFLRAFLLNLSLFPARSECPCKSLCRNVYQRQLVASDTKLGYARHRTSINFLSVISMNNYDVNLCNTNRRLPNGGVAAKEEIEQRKVESGNVLIIYHLNATHMLLLLLMPFTRKRMERKKYETFHSPFS
jgi:hypothetical protein